MLVGNRYLPDLNESEYLSLARFAEIKTCVSGDVVTSDRSYINEESPLSILLVGTQMAVGGAQRVLLDQASWFEAHGHHVTAVFFYDKLGLHGRWQAESRFPIYNLEAYNLNANSFRKFFLLIRGLFRYWILLRREHFDVVETFTHDSNLLGLPLAWLAGVPVRVATHHGMLKDIPRWREKTHTWIINHNIANILVAVSEGTRQRALKEGVAPDRVSLIPNGIVPVSAKGVNRQDIRKSIGVGEDDIFLISVGRLVYQKAHEFLIAAMPEVLKEVPNIEVGICGDGPLHSQLEMQIKSRGLAKSVKLLGTFDRIINFLAVADIFVLPSRWEGLPMALLEAMNAGLPVVATRVEGVDEVISDGENGLLVPAEDASALSHAILLLVHQPETRLRMGIAARQRIQRTYTTDRMCSQYLVLFQSIYRSELK